MTDINNIQPNPKIIIIEEKPEQEITLNRGDIIRTFNNEKLALFLYTKQELFSKEEWLKWLNEKADGNEL